MWVAVAGAVIGAGAGMYEASQSASAQKDAAATQAGAAQNAAQLQWQEFQQQQANMQPWLTQGTTAVNQLGLMMQPGGQLTQTTPTAAQLQMDPGYAFRQKAGANALAASGAAAGNYGSGNLGVALQNYGQGLASEEYQNAYNRYMNSQNTLYNRLAGLSGTGQVQSQAIGQMGMNTAINAGNLGMQGANALAAGKIGSANAWAGGLNSALNQGISGLGAYNQNQLYQQYLTNQSNLNSGFGGSYTPGDWNYDTTGAIAY